jgi:hypothetical protein
MPCKPAVTHSHSNGKDDKDGNGDGSKSDNGGNKDGKTKEARRMITAMKRARERARVERWMVTPTNRARARVGKRDGDGD